jgi:tetratricopeptide (TPR) repeat protein
MAKVNHTKSKNNGTVRHHFRTGLAWQLLPLLGITFLVYSRSIGYFITQLDDYILIFEKEQFNRITNIFKAFTVGTFNDKDIYYRPFLQITFMIEQLFSSDSVALYHFTNILLHLIAVYLVYRFFIEMGKTQQVALVVASLFALHPALTMAVAWIPGRNDSLLTVFTLCFFIHLLRYMSTANYKQLFLQALFFFMALFTKETALFIPIVALGIIYSLRLHSNIKQSLKLGTCWAIIIAVWILLKMNVSDNSLFKDGYAAQMSLIIERMPRLLLYLGKVFIPVQLSNYPSADNMNIWWGVIALVMLFSLIFITKNRNIVKILFGFFWFIVFIMPFFLVPKGINDQVFEHRLYLPIIGILLILSETAIMNGELNSAYLRYTFIGVLLFYSYQISTYLPRFSNPIIFWESAVKDSPNSSYAINQLGARYISENRKEEALQLFIKAHALNNEERYCRYFIARDYYLPIDSVEKAIQLLKEEIVINPKYVDPYFELANIYFKKNDLNQLLYYLEKSKELRPKDSMINNNLLLTYIKLNQKKKAEDLVNFMNMNGLYIPQKVTEDIKALQ